MSAEKQREEIKCLLEEVEHLRRAGNLLASVIRSGPRRAEIEALTEWENTCRNIFAPMNNKPDCR